MGPKCLLPRKHRHIISPGCAGRGKRTVSCTCLHLHHVLTYELKTQVVLAPVALGAALNQWFPQVVRRTAPFAPLVRNP